MMTLYEKIAVLRKEKGWSQEQLAEQLNVTRQTVSKWESGLSLPDLEKVVTLSECFGVSTDYLLKDDERKRKSWQMDNGMGENAFKNLMRAVMVIATTFNVVALVVGITVWSVWQTPLALRYRFCDQRTGLRVL